MSEAENAKHARYDFARRHEEARDRHINQVWLLCILTPLVISGALSAVWAITIGWEFAILGVFAFMSIPVMFIGGVVGLFVARTSARARFGPEHSLLEDRCAACGYDLSGVVSHRCPECGCEVADAPIAAAPPTAPGPIS